MQLPSKYECDWCNDKFSTIDALKHHEKTSCPELQRPAPGSTDLTDAPVPPENSVAAAQILRAISQANSLHGAAGKLSINPGFGNPETSQLNMQMSQLHANIERSPMMGPGRGGMNPLNGFHHLMTSQSPNSCKINNNNNVTESDKTGDRSSGFANTGQFFSQIPPVFLRNFFLNVFQKWPKHCQKKIMISNLVIFSGILTLNCSLQSSLLPIISETMFLYL